MSKSHLRYCGTLKFDLCTTMNSVDLETTLKEFFQKLNNKFNFDGSVDEVDFDKIALCTDDCLGGEGEPEEEY